MIVVIYSGADTRLLSVLSLFKAVCSEEVRFVSYVSILGKNEADGTLSWEHPHPMHLRALHDMGINVASVEAASSETRDIVSPLELLLKSYDPDWVVVTLWFWTWPLRPVYAEVINLAHQRSLSGASHRRLIVLSDDCHADRESARESTNIPNVDQGGERSIIAHGQLRSTMMHRWTFIINKNEREHVKAKLLAASPERTRAMAEIENNIYDAADAVLAITPEDRKRMELLWKNRNTNRDSEEEKHFYTLRPVLFEDSIIVPQRSFGERKNFLFVGSGKNPGNVEAVNFFLIKIWPKLRELVGKRTLFIIVGELPSGGYWAEHIKTKQQQLTAGVKVTGFVKGDIMKKFEPAAAARVFVCPVRVSSGLNTKTLLALQNGIPLVSTAAGATGLPMGAAIVVNNSTNSRSEEEDGREFADAAAAVYLDETLWNKRAEMGKGTAAKHFSEVSVRSELSFILADVRDHTHKKIKSSRSNLPDLESSYHPALFVV